MGNKLKARYNWTTGQWTWFPYRPEQLELHMKLAEKYPYYTPTQQTAQKFKPNDHHDDILGYLASYQENGR